MFRKLRFLMTDDSYSVPAGKQWCGAKPMGFLYWMLCTPSIIASFFSTTDNLPGAP
jgi:hypothetical protein